MAENNLSPIGAEDYKKRIKITASVKAPSGAIFLVRPFAPLDFMDGNDFATIIKAGKGDATDPETMQNNLKVIRKILPKCVLSPKVVEGESKEGELSIDSDITSEDLLFLIQKITEVSSASIGKVDFLGTKGSPSPSTE